MLLKGMEIVSRSAHQIYVKIPYKYKDTAKTIPGYAWHPEYKCWSFPMNENTLERLGLNPASETPAAPAANGRRPEIDRFKRELQNLHYKRKPFAHQQEMSARILAYHQYALLTEMGTGKTSAVIHAAAYLFSKSIISRVLVVAPNSVLYSWKKELEENGVPDRHIAVLRGSKGQRIKELDKTAKIWIINYEGILVIEDLLKRKFNNRQSMIVLDESSKIKNWQAKRTKIIRAAWPLAEYRVIMSGTPITQSPLDIFPQYKFLHPDALPFRTFYSFRGKFATMGGYENREIVGYRNMEELKRLISHRGIIIKKKDCLDLPPKIPQLRKLEMSKAMRQQYKELKNNLMVEFEGATYTAAVAITKILRLQQITSGMMNEQKDNNKMKELLDILDESYGNGTKVLIWFRFLEPMDQARELLEKKGIPCLMIRGDVDTKDRQNNIDMFNGSNKYVMLAQIQCGGMGLNLQTANQVIYYENSFSLENRLQSEDRAHRIGMTGPVTYIDLAFENSIDEDIIRAVQDKKEIADYLIESYFKRRK